MKPLLDVTILLRDPMNPEVPARIGKIGVEFIGHLVVTLTRNEIGEVKLESVACEPNAIWQDAIEDAAQTLKALHECLGDTHIATQHSLADMFAVHKLLTG